MEKQKELIESAIENIFKNTERIHGNSEVLDWIKIAAHKSAEYLLKSNLLTEPQVQESLSYATMNFDNVVRNAQIDYNEPQEKPVLTNNPIAYEWICLKTGHCYVDYVKRPDIENTGDDYEQRPLVYADQKTGEKMYPESFVLYMSGDRTNKGTTLKQWYDEWARDKIIK